MKLGALKAAIRASTEAPKLYTAALGPPILVTLQKGPLLEQLDAVFTEGKAQETGLLLRDDGCLMRDPQP